MKTSIIGLAAGLLMLASSAVHASIIKFENNMDRPGGKYLAHYGPVGSPQHCMEICKGNPACVAFTWVRPGVQGPNGVCWLKSTASNKVPNNCCVSGIVGKPKNAYSQAYDYCEWRTPPGGSRANCMCRRGATGNWVLGNPDLCRNRGTVVVPRDFNSPDIPGGSCVFGQC